MIEALGEAIRDHFGIDIDGETLRKGPQAIEEALQEAMRAAQADEGRKRKKPQKQLAKKRSS